MRKKVKGIVTILLSLLLLLINVLGNNFRVNAQGNIHVINPDPKQIVLVPGETVKLKVPIRAVGETIKSPVLTVDASNAPYTVLQPTIWTEGLDTPLKYIYDVINQYVEMEVVVAEDAKIGTYPITLYIDGLADTIDGEESVSTKLVINTQILKERQPAQLSLKNITFENPTIGQEMILSFKVRNEGEIAARNVYVSIDYADTGMIAAYPAKNFKIDDITSHNDVAVRLPIKVLPTATVGMKSLKVNLTHKTAQGDTVTESHDIYLSLRENDNAPNLNLSDFSYNTTAKPGENLGLVLNIKNTGMSKAVNPRIYVDESSIGTSKFIKGYYTDYIELKNISADSTIKADIPLIISKENTGGLQELKLNLVYFDSEGVERKSSVTIYPQIVAEGVSEDGRPIILISNVLQSPKQPVAGGKLEISFDMVNKSAIDLNEFKLSLKNLTGDTFIPVDSDPYQYIGTLKAGASKRITIPLTVSDNIQEGLNTLTIAYSYAGAGGEDVVDIPVLDVQNDLGSASKPRLIVSKYEADIDEIKAGSVFNFNFEIRNTHSSVAAKNIIITVSGKSQSGQEVFSVTQGSSSFFVSKIGAGETFSDVLEMKVKSDTATGAYPINVTIEYEYDGIKPNPTTGKIGETENYDLNLQVIENARPVVDYVNVYSWDGGVMVNNPSTLSFDFYNMGKSMLNNVVATIEGDFMPSGSTMQFLGNVMAGGNAYAEFEVIPTVEGTAYGVVKITYEDSNGEEQVYTKEFDSFVMGEQIWNPDIDGGGIDVFNPTVPEPKKAILPTWLFILIEAIIFIIFIPISRKAIISIYKSRLRKKDEEMY